MRELVLVEDDRRPWRGCLDSYCESRQWVCDAENCEVRRVR